MPTESAPQPIPPETPKEEDKLPSRRDFLKKAGKFFGGMLATGSVAETLYRSGKSAAKTLEAKKDEYLFSQEKLQAEIAEIKKLLPKDWENKVRNKIREGIKKYLDLRSRVLNEEKKQESGWKGFAGGTALGVGVEITKDVLKQEQISSKKLIEVFNRIGVYGGIGALLNYLTTGKEPPQSQKEYLKVLENVAFDSLGIEPDLKTAGLEEIQKDLQRLIPIYTEHVSRQLILKVRVRDQLQQWGAGTIITLLHEFDIHQKIFENKEKKGA